MFGNECSCGAVAQAMAATKIQASFRGRQVRKMQTKDEVGDKSETEAAPPAPPDEGSQTCETPTSEDRAATKIQAGFRGKRDRDLLKRQDAASRTIQRMWRGEYTRRVVGNRVESHRFAAAVVKASRRHNNWLEVFNNVVSDQPAVHGATMDLNLPGFREALKKVHPQISGAQAEALFEGYTKGMGKTYVDLIGFIDIADAVAKGNREAAEFSEMSADAFSELATLETLQIPGATSKDMNQEAAKAAQGPTHVDGAVTGTP